MLLFIKGVTAQNRIEYDKAVVVKEVKTDSIHYEYALSGEFITNRDYITYILWKTNVYGADYPGTVLDAFPGYDQLTINDYYTNPVVKKYYNCDTPIHYLIVNSQWFLKDYLFNSRYIDYPVIGITKKQASKFNKWLGDRYNEYLLIEKRHYKMNLNQIDEDNFVTDSYLAGMYFGYNVVDSFVTWDDNVLLNNFRLPTMLEQPQVETKLKKNTTRKEFLKCWQDSFFEVSKKGILIKLKYPSVSKKAKSLIPNPRIKVNLKSLTFSEMFLGRGKVDYLKGFYEQGYLTRDSLFFKDPEGYNYEKDSLGLMNYIIVGRENSDGMFLIEQDGFKRIQREPRNEVEEFKVFRYAFTLKHLK